MVVFFIFHFTRKQQKTAKTSFQRYTVQSAKTLLLILACAYVVFSPVDYNLNFMKYLFIKLIAIFFLSYGSMIISLVCLSSSFCVALFAWFVLFSSFLFGSTDGLKNSQILQILQQKSMTKSTVNNKNDCIVVFNQSNNTVVL